MKGGRIADTAELVKRPSNINCKECMKNGVYTKPEELGDYYVCPRCGLVGRKGKLDGKPKKRRRNRRRNRQR